VTVSGIDPETARALGIAGVVATIVASLVALVSSQLAAYVARSTAKDIARLQSETQLLVDRRRVLRDHRAERLRGFLEHTAHRFGAWQDVFVAAQEEDKTELERRALRVFDSGVVRDLAFMSTPDAEFQEVAREFIRADNHLKRIVNAALERPQLSSLDREMQPHLDRLRDVITRLGIVAERYILGAYWERPDIEAFGRLTQAHGDDARTVSSVGPHS
jgi:hypothetical protein